MIALSFGIAACDCNGHSMVWLARGSALQDRKTMADSPLGKSDFERVW
jgi:hypothetical protein